MMTSTAFHQWCDQLALPPATRDLLAGIRGSQPVRRVTSRANKKTRTRKKSEENPPVETRLSVEGSSEPTQDVPPKRPGRGRKKATELQTQPIELSQPALSATGGASLPAGEVEVGAAPSKEQA